MSEPRTVCLSNKAMVSGKTREEEGTARERILNLFTFSKAENFFNDYIYQEKKIWGDT